jgi:small subunit ribosomal protein S18
VNVKAHASLVDSKPCHDYLNPFDDLLFSRQANARRSMVRKKLGRGRKNRCRFCTKEGCPRPAFVDYKDVQGLKKMCTSQGKLFSRKRSGNCAAFQRAVKDAVKRARFMALLPYVGE